MGMFRKDINKKIMIPHFVWLLIMILWMVKQIFWTSQAELFIWGILLIAGINIFKELHKHDERRKDSDIQGDN